MTQDSHSGSNASLLSNNEYDLESQEFWTLSGKKPFFDVILAKTNLHPHYRLMLPGKIQPVLPSLTIPVVLTFGAKEWKTTYHGNNGSGTRFDALRKFADDNSLKIGDACVFELKEWNSKKLVFRVQVLRGDIPPELLSKIFGESLDSPIVIE